MNAIFKKNERKESLKQSTALSLSENFHKYFRVVFADSKELRQTAFKIRHQVYCEELGWEERNQDGMEIDEFDDYSYHCLIQHRATKSFAGCLRLVIPTLQKPTRLTPFEKYSLSSIRPEMLDLSSFNRGRLSELSRLAVTEHFRRRRNEVNHPFTLNATSNIHVFSDEERRHFPNIAIGLYISALALADLLHHEVAFIMIEPKMHRRLIKFGLPFIQGGDAINYHGIRALYYLPAANMLSGINSELRQLFVDISRQFKQEIRLIPFIDPTDH